MDTVSSREQPFINKPCISESVCKSDAIKALEKVKDRVSATENLDDYICVREVIKYINEQINEIRGE